MKTYEEGIVKGFSHNIKTVEELEERIKKAIEIIEKPLFIELDNIDINYLIERYNHDLKEIKKILKGE